MHSSQSSSTESWVCSKCGLVASAPTAPECSHPGFPFGPGFSPKGGAKGYASHFRQPRQMMPYSGSVEPGLTDPAYHELMPRRRR